MASGTCQAAGASAVMCTGLFDSRGDGGQATVSMLDGIFSWPYLPGLRIKKKSIPIIVLIAKDAKIKLFQVGGEQGKVISDEKSKSY